MDKLFGPGAFPSGPPKDKDDIKARRRNLINEKLEVFFQDFSAMPLWTQVRKSLYITVRVICLCG
jgi:uncharacterized Rmd1/YagE family protein